MKEGEIRYFRYYHYSVDGFRVLLSKMFGKGKIAVNVVPKDSQDYESFEPDFKDKSK